MADVTSEIKRLAKADVGQSLAVKDVCMRAFVSGKKSLNWRGGKITFETCVHACKISFLACCTFNSEPFRCFYFSTQCREKDCDARQSVKWSKNSPNEAQHHF